MAAYIDVKSPQRSRSTLFRWYCNHTNTWKRKFWCGCIAADVCCCVIIAVVTALAVVLTVAAASSKNDGSSVDWQEFGQAMADWRLREAMMEAADPLTIAASEQPAGSARPAGFVGHESLASARALVGAGFIVNNGYYLMTYKTGGGADSVDPEEVYGSYSYDDAEALQSNDAFTAAAAISPPAPPPPPARPPGALAELTTWLKSSFGATSYTISSRRRNSTTTVNGTWSGPGPGKGKGEGRPPRPDHQSVPPSAPGETQYAAAADETYSYDDETYYSYWYDHDYDPTCGLHVGVLTANMKGGTVDDDDAAPLAAALVEMAEYGADDADAAAGGVIFVCEQEGKDGGASLGARAAEASEGGALRAVAGTAVTAPSRVKLQMDMVTTRAEAFVYGDGGGWTAAADGEPVITDLREGVVTFGRKSVVHTQIKLARSGCKDVRVLLSCAHFPTSGEEKYATKTIEAIDGLAGFGGAADLTILAGDINLRLDAEATRVSLASACDGAGPLACGGATEPEANETRTRLLDAFGKSKADQNESVKCKYEGRLQAGWLDRVLHRRRDGGALTHVGRRDDSLFSLETGLLIDSDHLPVWTRYRAQGEIA